MSLRIAQTARTSSMSDPARYLVADARDDAPSLAAKLAQTESRRVVLVIPSENRALENPVALRVLARASDHESIELVLVSQRARLRWMAAAEGLIVFPSLADVPTETAPAPAAWPGTLRAALAEATGMLERGSRWAVAIGLVLVVFSIVAMILPRAVVYVQPVTDQVSGTVRITASSDATAVDLNQGILTSRVVYLLVSARGTIPITSADHPLDGHAVGFVTLENRASQRLIVPEGTDLSTFSGVHFATTKPANLGDSPGTTAEVPIVAAGAGEYGNVLRGQIVVVGGPLRWLITSVNEEKTAGGGAAGQPTVTAWETHRLLDEIMARSRVDAAQKLGEVVSANEIAVPESVKVTPIAETFDHSIGDPAPSLSGTVQCRVEALIVNQHDLNALAVSTWHPAVRPGFIPVPNSIHLGTPSVVKISPTSVTFDVPVSGRASAQINADRLVSYVRLRSPREAERDIAQRFDLASPPTVTITPGWLSRAYRVRVVVKTNATPATASASR